MPVVCPYNGLILFVLLWFLPPLPVFRDQIIAEENLDRPDGRISRSVSPLQDIRRSFIFPTSSQFPNTLPMEYLFLTLYQQNVCIFFPLLYSMKIPRCSTTLCLLPTLHLIVFFPQSFLKHNKTFHKLFQDIPEGENLTHSELNLNQESLTYSSILIMEIMSHCVPFTAGS